MAGETNSQRPYLLRALYDWISDNRMTPHILVDAAKEGVDVPEQAVQKGKVILNIDKAAVRDLVLANDWVSFNARFSGRRYDVKVPLHAVLAIYAKESGQGMMFEEEKPTPPAQGSSPVEFGTKRGHLKVVK